MHLLSDVGGPRQSSLPYVALALAAAGVSGNAFGQSR